MRNLISKIVNNVWLDSIACVMFYILVILIIKLFVVINFLGVLLIGILIGHAWSQMFYRESDND